MLLTLMYYREYRTQFHIGHTYGIFESAVCRIIERIENILIKIKELQLPGKKMLARQQEALSVVVIDANEIPIERQKKTAAVLQQQEKATYYKGAGRGSKEEQAYYLYGARHWKDA